MNVRRATFVRPNERPWRRPRSEEQHIRTIAIACGESRDGAMAAVLAAKSMIAGSGKVTGDAQLHALASARMFAQTQGHLYLRWLGANDE